MIGYVIEATDQADAGLFWSSNYGWVTFKAADLFTKKDTEQLLVPLGGRWLPVLAYNGKVA